MNWSAALPTPSATPAETKPTREEVKARLDAACVELRDGELKRKHQWLSKLADVADACATTAKLGRIVSGTE